MVKVLAKEKWAVVRLRNSLSKRKYAVSNFGRMASYQKSIAADGRLIAKSAGDSRSPHISILFKDGKRKLYVNHLVAKYFVDKPSPKHNKIIHKDKDSSNNKASNLQWVTADEAERHHANTKPGKNEKLHFFVGEKYKIVKLSGLKKNYAITNFGRLISFVSDVNEGVVLRLSNHPQGYKIWRFKQGDMYRHYLLHRLVAEYFIEPPTDECICVVHINHTLTDNRAENLQWLTVSDQRKHSAQSKASKLNAVRLSQISRTTGKGKKLTEGKVKMIKKIINDPKRSTRLKMVAKQFGISSMQLYRIQTGENWGWVKI